MGSQKKTPPRQLPLKRKLTYSAIVVVLAVGVPELLLRLFWDPLASVPYVGERRFIQRLTKLSVSPGSPQQLYQEHAERLWSLIPGVKIEGINHHYNRQGGEAQRIHITINEDGYRGPRAMPHKEENAFRVLCLGDSNMFGYPLDDEDAFPSALKRSLSREIPNRTVEVINAGTPGYTVLQGRRWYDAQFASYDYDWLILSYINNDAWPQPERDIDLFARRRVLPTWLTTVSNKVRLVQWGQTLRDRRLSSKPLVPRVSLEEYTDNYNYLIRAAQQKGARVLLLDFRAYPKYEPYSEQLQRMAQDTGAEYVYVMQRCEEALQRFDNLELQYGESLRRIHQRWGDQLLEYPHLWMYAELYPEHLSEVGTAFLADELQPLFKMSADESAEKR